MNQSKKDNLICQSNYDDIMYHLGTRKLVLNAETKLNTKTATEKPRYFCNHKLEIQAPQN